MREKNWHEKLVCETLIKSSGACHRKIIKVCSNFGIKGFFYVDSVCVARRNVNSYSRQRYIYCSATAKKDVSEILRRS